jgi:hypothetical protein
MVYAKRNWGESFLGAVSKKRRLKVEEEEITQIMK